MRSFLLLFTSLLAVQAKEGGLRRLRQGDVNSQYLGLDKEVDGQALHRVLRHKQREMIGFENFGIMDDGRERLYDQYGSASESAAENPETTKDLVEGGAAVDLSYSMSLSMSYSMSLSMSMELGLVSRTEPEMSMSMSMSMSM